MLTQLNSRRWSANVSPARLAAAVHAGKTAPSPTLLAIGRDTALATAALRLTLGIETTRAEIDEAAMILTNAVSRLCQPALQAEKGNG